MKVTKQELKDFGLFDSLPEKLKNLGTGNYFVFYYDVDEENLKLKVFEDEVVKVVNVSLYRGMQEKQSKYRSSIKIGFFSDTFETKDGIFYQFLRTYNSPDKVAEFYSNAIEQDKFVELNIATDAITEVYNSDDFRRSISYFSPSRIQTIMFVYDMVNQAFEKKLSKKLYGDCIKKAVSLVKFDGGVLPDMNGSFRFMVIGENANLSLIQKQRLEEAKMLIRSLQPIDKIYAKTGWALGDRDGKWRTNIADDKASLSNSLLYDYGGRKLYIPQGNTQEGILPLLNNPEKLYAFGYQGRLSDIVKHPTLYEYYPRLASMPLIYWYGDNNAGGENFYFSDNSRGGFILINGSKQSGDSLSIMLHEIQHSIQRVEGYATGGNLFFAQFVASLGGNSVRKIFACINKMQHYFRDELFSDSDRLQLQDIIKYSLYKSSEAKGLRNSILEYFKDQDTYTNSYKTVNFLMILLIAEEGDFSSNDLVMFLQDKIGDIVFELFENVSAGYSVAKKYREKLLGEGYREGDIGSILFKGYENLYGEMESRSVQSSRFLQSEYKNYFYLTSWEREPLQQLTIIDGIEEIINCTEIKAAVETKDGVYVLHFEKSNSITPFLHELGHIVYDGLVTLGYQDRIKKEFDKEIIKDIEEFFVSRFIGYLRERLDDDRIRMDTKMDFSIRANEEINKILDEFFADAQISERLKYLQTVLSLI